MKTFEMVIKCPSYARNKKSHYYDKFENYNQFMEKKLKECLRVLRQTKASVIECTIDTKKIYIKYEVNV